MSKSAAFEAKGIDLFFNNTTVAGLGSAAGVLGSATAGSLYVSLHSADPGEAGTQLTSELAYSGYARVAVARSAAGWTVSTANGQAVLAANITFPTAGGTGATAHFWGIGFTSAGTGVLMYSGTAAPAVAITSGVVPTITTASTVTED